MSIRLCPHPARLTLFAACLGLLWSPEALCASDQQTKSGPEMDQSTEKASLPAGLDANTTQPALPTVWYRNSEGCPNGEQFVLRVLTYQREVRLAEAGDRVDFVVTMTKTSAGPATGRLERQTEAGTIAISEVRDADCDAVATALALGLSLSLTPSPPPTPAMSTAASSGTRVTTDAHPTPSASSSRDVSRRAAVTPAARAPTADASEPPRTSKGHLEAPHARSPAAAAPAPRWSFGLQGEGAFLLNPSPVWGGDAFLEHRANNGGWGTSSARAGVAVHYGREATAVGDVQQWLLAFRASACPLSWSPGPLWVAPCAEMDLGAVTATGTGAFGDRATALWASAAATGRWAIPVGARFALTGQFALRAALNPYAMHGGGGLLFESRLISPWVALGVLFPL